MASAPPKGSVLATSDPARLTVSALRCEIPGSAPVMVKVKASSAHSWSNASNARTPGCNLRSGSTISDQPTPATLGNPQASSTTASASDPTSRRTRHQSFPCRHQGRLCACCTTTPACHEPRPRQCAAAGAAGQARHRRPPPVPPTCTDRLPADGRRSMSVGAVTVILVPPSTTATPGTATGGRDDATTPAAAGDASPTGPRWLRRLWGYCWRHPVITLLAALSAVGGVGLGALTPLLTQVAVDDATSGNTSSLGWVIAGLVALALIRFGSSFLRRWAGGRLSLDVQHDMRQDVFGALQRLDGSGQDRLRTGQVVSRASTDLQMVQGLLAMVPLSAGQVVLFVFSLVIMLTLSPLLTLMALLVVPAVAVVTRATRTVLFPATWAAQQSAAEVAEIVEEDVTGVRVVKGFGQEDREVQRLRGGAARLFADRMRAVRLTAKISPSMQAMTSLGQVGVLALGGYLALSGVITLGTFLAFTLYLAQLVAPTRMLTMLLVSAQQARASVERVLEIIDSVPQITEVPNPRVLPTGTLAVEFSAVRFGYAADDPVLRCFDLRVAPGSTVALVGASGSGKSTVSLLLPRFYDPQAGTVRVGGVDLCEAGMSDLRRSVGVVFEEAFLFSDTIAANIAYGRPDATDADIRAAAMAAEATGFIEALPEGFATVIGERGLTLSGGQRQRLALPTRQ